ncbi:MAG: methyl-accepting chemotaxis protein, partial [Leptolyngbyaceae cyanobacterium bins.59]|nr:methyl-accepting chemotaxis protein [Leptolyngbyaceae cyanobacterium bins.59]
PRSPQEETAYRKLEADWDDWKADHEAYMKVNERFEATGILNPYETLLEVARAGRSNSAEGTTAQRAVEVLEQLRERAQGNRVSFEKATNSVLAVLKINEDTAASAKKASATDISRVGFWIMVGMILGPTTAILFGIYFSNTIAKPMGAKIAGVVDVAQKISSGDLTTQVQLSDQQDEIGKLLHAFHTMNKDLNTLIRRVQQSGIQITTSATQIAASGKELEATVAEQIASTNEVSATSQEIAATSRELVRTMEQVATMAQTTAIAAGSSQTDLIRMETVMRQLAEATMSISTRLGVMNEKANNINNVVTTITKVADQTNLLSLNAAIEAEKAGEYGAGFAVVAREIRRLADQTAVATLEIEQMVKEMQTAVSGGVMEMDKFNKSVVDTVDDVGKISTQIAQVIDQVQGLTPRFSQVSQSMEEQSQGAQQISEAMQQLTEASQQTADALRETNSALEQLDDAAQGLQSEISRFRVA